MIERISERAEAAVGDENYARAKADESREIWRLERHCCRACFGRIASTPYPDGDGRLYRCTNCGAEGAGSRPSVICACGLKLHKARRDGRSGVVLADAGIRCHENHNRTPEFPSLIVASFAGAQVEPD